jgi:transcriptional regulator with XRE-family HTH domain
MGQSAMLYDAKMGKDAAITRKTKRARHYLREWRDFRGMSQEAAAARMEMTQSAISKTETGKQGYDQAFLEKAAALYRCSTGDLLTVNPLDPEQPARIPETTFSLDEVLHIVELSLQATGHDGDESAVLVGFVREVVEAPLSGVASENPKFARRLRFEDAMRRYFSRQKREKAQ